MKTLPDKAQARGKQSNKQNNNQTLKTIEESNNLTINESNKQLLRQSQHYSVNPNVTPSIQTSRTNNKTRISRGFAHQIK